MEWLSSVTLRPDPSPHVRFSPPANPHPSGCQKAVSPLSSKLRSRFLSGFANTTLGPSPSFYADPGRGWLFGKPVPTALTARLACQREWELSRSLVKGLVGCGIYSTRSGTDVDDIITTSLFVPLGMLNATSPTGVTCAFVSLSVVSTGCFRAARLTPIRISSSKLPYPIALILE